MRLQQSDLYRQIQETFIIREWRKIDVPRCISELCARETEKK